MPCESSDQFNENSIRLQESDPVYLSDISPDDKPWDVHRKQVDQVRDVYHKHGFAGYVQRMGNCSGELGFAWQHDAETGEARLKLRLARFCRVRYCPVCQWRRSQMWKARFWRSLPGLVELYPSHRWLFLTLTVRNCEITELRATLSAMSQAWRRLTLRKEFSAVEGWVRTSEVTRGLDGSAHPHFHCLLMVKSSYFTGKRYVKQSQWCQAWKASARLSYEPVCDVRTVKPKKCVSPGSGSEIDQLARGIADAVSETLKYSVKPSDMVEDDGWFIELTKQTHRLRFIASGGSLKDVLREGDESDEGMTGTEGEGENIQPSLFFDWLQVVSRYRKNAEKSK